MILQDSRIIRIDEKVRYRAYGDIALEYLSSVQHQKPGWVCKPLAADYIAYAIKPMGKCFLLPVVQLQLAWSRRGHEWISQYPQIDAENPGYTTRSVGVPYRELMVAIVNGLCVEFSTEGA